MAVLLLASASPLGGQPIQTICSFNNSLNPNGLTLGNDGNFYGTTFYGGTTNSTFSDGMGTVFQVTTNGTLSTLASFNFTNGALPSGLLTLGNGGSFYGTTILGGISNAMYYPYGLGTVFQVTTNGTLTTLASFNPTEGAYPNGVTLGNDGNFYGTTESGGSTTSGIIDGWGTVFQVTTNGTLTALTSFNSTNGATPNSRLTLGNDGNFYGATLSGGYYGMGTFFQVMTNGTLTKLASFNSTDEPDATLTLGNDGNFYGTTEKGGITDSEYPEGMGTVFQATTNGTLTTLASFNFTNEAYPSGLTLGNDGNFYGTTSEGGITNSAYPQGMGTVFQVTTNGTLTTLASFNFTNGANPYSALALGNDGSFYGITSEGGITNSTYPQGAGTIFRLVLSLVISLQPQSQTNYAGATATFRCATFMQPNAFQWQKNGTNLANGGNISGATNSTLTITSIADSDAASYSVVVSSAEGSVSSSNATLTVNDSDFFATQPLSQTVGAGSMVAFTATVYGAQPFVIQWYFNGKPIGSPIADTSFSSYTLTNVTTNQSGNYTVQLIGRARSLTSSNAVLTVIPQPTLGLQILAGYPALNLHGTVSNNFVVQYNSNLTDTNWLNLLFLTNLSTKSYLFLDPSAADQPARFYRAFFTQ